MSKLTPMKAIKAHCVECSGGVKSEVRKCPIKTCDLWAYRLGHRPKAENLPTEDAHEEKGPEKPMFFDAEEGDENDGLS